MPASWAKPSDAPWQEGFALDDKDIIVVYPDEMPLVVDRSNVREWASALRSGISSAISGLPAPTFRSIGGLPSMQLHLTIGTDGTSKSVTEVFDGSSGYIVECQSSPDRVHDVSSACDALSRSFAIQDAGGAARADWQTLSSDSGRVSISVPPEWAAEHPSDRGTIIQAKLALEGSGALSRVWIESGPLPRAVVSSVLATTIIHQMPGSWRVTNRRPFSLPEGRAERVELQQGRNVVVMYFLAKGHTGYMLGWRFSGPADLRFFGSTPDVVARSLVIG